MYNDDLRTKFHKAQESMDDSRDRAEKSPIGSPEYERAIREEIEAMYAICDVEKTLRAQIEAMDERLRGTPAAFHIGL